VRQARARFKRVMLGVVIDPRRAKHAYAPFYCEENVWHLAGDPRIEADERFVVFISNGDRACLLWSQSQSPAPDRPVVWDYHVVLVARRGEERLVYDLDTKLEFPERLERYLLATFPIDELIDPRLRPRFRVVGADTFRAKFASDRSHMLVRGKYRAPPPEWPCIRTDTETMNLDRFIDMGHAGEGEVFENIGALMRRFELTPR
jgi:protein N-terminal glutamine amidohydrolase